MQIQMFSGKMKHYTDNRHLSNMIYLGSSSHLLLHIYLCDNLLMNYNFDNNQLCDIITYIVSYTK